MMGALGGLGESDKQSILLFGIKNDHIQRLVTASRVLVPESRVYQRDFGSAPFSSVSTRAERFHPRHLRWERRIREDQLSRVCNIVRQLEQCHGSITEVWFGGTDLIGVVQQILPRAQYGYFEHGISDVLYNLDRPVHQFKDKQRLRRQLERATLGTSYLALPPRFRVSLIAQRSDREVDDDIIYRAWQQCANETQGRRNQSAKDHKILILLPNILAETSDLQLTTLLGHLRHVLNLEGLQRNSEILIKAHPSSIVYGFGDFSSEFASLAKAAVDESVSIRTIQPLTPAEILLGDKVDVLVCTLGTTLLAARRWFPNIRVYEIPWVKESIEAWRGTLGACEELTAPFNLSREWRKYVSHPHFRQRMMAYVAHEEKVQYELVSELHSRYPDLSWTRLE